MIRIDGLQARRERQGRLRRDHKAWLTAIWAVLTLSIIVCGSQAKVLAQQSAGDSWVGKRVITQNGTVLKVGNQVVDDAGHGKQLAQRKGSQHFPRLQGRAGERPLALARCRGVRRVIPNRRRRKWPCGFPGPC